MGEIEREDGDGGSVHIGPRRRPRQSRRDLLSGIVTPGGPSAETRPALRVSGGGGSTLTELL
jgi:hypothetical protein